MRASTNFYHLVASLPYMPRTFEVERLPISRIQLQQRLKLLSDPDRRVVDQIQEFLLWDRQRPERTDEEVEREYDRLVNSIKNPLVRDMINHRMDVRTINCALRRRRLGLEPPSGVGQYVEHIRKNWRHPDFRLAREHPWIPRLHETLEAKQALDVERQLLAVTWNRWVKLAEEFYFSFETVLLYLARWEIVDRWTRLNRSAGEEKFDHLLMEVLDGHASIDR